MFQTVGFNALVSLALVTGAAGKTAVLVYTLPFWTLIFAWPVLGERIRGLQSLAVALAGVAGLSIMAVPALGVLFSRLQLGETPGPAEAAGMVLICASLAVLSWHALRRPVT